MRLLEMRAGSGAWLLSKGWNLRAIAFEITGAKIVFNVRLQSIADSIE